MMIGELPKSSNVQLTLNQSKEHPTVVAIKSKYLLWERAKEINKT